MVDLGSLVVGGAEDDIADLGDGDVEGDVRVPREGADAGPVSRVEDSDGAVHPARVDHRLCGVADHADDAVDVVELEAEVPAQTLPDPDTSVTRTSHRHGVTSTIQNITN